MKTQNLLQQWEQSVTGIQSAVYEASIRVQSSIRAGEELYDCANPPEGVWRWGTPSYNQDWIDQCGD